MHCVQILMHLPVEEHTGLSFCSQNPGIMHACGHDCHIAMLLGGIRLLMAQKEQLKGNVKIIFQAAEESCHGAQYYVEHGFLDDVNAIYGVHIWGDLDAPYMNFESGPRMASCDNFRIEVEGISAHGSTPHQGVDAILAAAHIITEIQTVVSRMNDPLNPLVITVGNHQRRTTFQYPGRQSCHGGNYPHTFPKNAPKNRTFTPQNHRKYSGFHGCKGYPYI